MNKNNLFELVLFDPENTMITLLEKRNIAFQKVVQTRQFLVAMDETIEIVSNDNNDIQIENIVLIFMEWLKGKPYRKLQAQLVDGSIVYIDKDDQKRAISILKDALKVTVFDPEYNNRILNK